MWHSSLPRGRQPPRPPTPLRAGRRSFVPQREALARRLAPAGLVLSVMTLRDSNEPGSGSLRAAITASNNVTAGRGSLQIGSAAGLTSLTGNSTASLALVGTVADVNHALQSLRFRPTKGFLGTAQLTLTAQDVDGAGGALSEPATATVALRYLDHAPRLDRRRAVVPFAARADETLAVSARRGVLTRLLDQDHDRLTVRLVGRPSAGRLRVLPSGAFRFTPPPHFTGVVRFTVRASDGLLVSKLLPMRLRIS